MPIVEVNTAVGARGLTIAYGSTVALRVDDIALPAGTVSALIGPNGSGKTTLLHAIAGILRPSSGTLTVATDRPAYVLQEAHSARTLPLTVRETVTMGRYAHTGLVGRMGGKDRDAVQSAMERLEIADLGSRQLRELSGGQRQRVLVAQGLAQESDLLLLDEPLAGLDLVSRHRILEVIADERAAGRTVVVTTHDLADARGADLVVLLSGRVVACGSADEVLRAEHLADAYGSRLQRLDDGLLLLDDAPEHGHVH